MSAFGAVGRGFGFCPLAIVVPLAAAVVLVPTRPGGSVPPFGLFGLPFPDNLVYLATLIASIVMLATPTRRTENHYGAPPRG